MGIYSALEEKYYEFLDWLDTIGIPLWKLAQPIEARGIPSFPIFVLVVLLILGGIGWSFYTMLFGPKVYLVTVLDPNGNPISGAVVRIGKERYITGPDGTVEILLKGDESIWVLASGFKDIVLSPEDIESGKRIVLEPETKDARIIITDTKGRRIDAHVKVFGADKTYEFHGSEISFKLSRVSMEDAVRVGENLTVRVEVTAEGYQKAVKTLSWNAPSITVRLKKKAPPSGTLYIRTDPPINGWAYLLVGGSPVYSGIIKSGAGTIRGVEYGSYTLKIVPVVDGKKVETLDNVFTVTVNAPTVTQTYQVKIPDINKLLETVIRVVDANTNKPINAIVTVKETNSRYTAYNGTLTIQMKKDSTFTVTVSATKYYPQTFKISAGENKTVRLVRMPATGSIVVTVVDIHGNPVQGAKISLLTENEEFVAEGSVTDADGRVVFSEIGVGKYIAEACKGAVCARSDLFELKEDEKEKVRITLAPGYGSVYITLSVDGVPAVGRVRAVRSDTGEVLAKTETGIDGEGYLENIPAYVDFHIEAEAGGVTYVSTRMRLFPNEAKHLSIDLKTDLEEGFRVVGIYVGNQRVGILQGGKTYTVKIRYACSGSCSETFQILDGVGLFRDTDFPGEYTITVDGSNPAGEGAYLSVALKCNALCEGEFSAELVVSAVATFGEKLTIQYGESTFSAPIAWEGSCGNYVCASLHFEREGDPVDPLQLYEELEYDMEIDVLWGGEEIPYGRIVITPNGPADVNLQGGGTYVYRGTISYGTFLRITGSLYSEDPGYQEFAITVSSCDASYTNCRELDTYAVDAYFNEEVGRQLVIVAEPAFFLDCPNFPVRIRLLDENGTLVEFDPNTMQLDVLGIREIGGTYVSVRLNVEHSGDAFLVTLENPAEFDYVLVRADGFNYDAAEMYIWRDDVSLEIGTASYNFTWDNEESVGFTVYNPSAVPIQITNVFLGSSCIEGVSWDTSSPIVEPGGTSTVYVTPTFRQPCGGMEVEDTLAVEFVPVIDGTPLTACTHRTSTQIAYLIAPHCINITSIKQTDIGELRITFKNNCIVDISTAYAEILAYTASYAGCDTCFFCGELLKSPEKTYSITCTYYPSDEAGKYAELDLIIYLLVTFMSGAQEGKSATYINFVYVDEDTIHNFVTFEPAENINPNNCSNPGVLVGTVKKTEAGAEYSWLEIDAHTPQLDIGGYKYSGIGEWGGSGYAIYLPTRDPETHKPEWYAPFAHGGSVTISVTVDAIINVENKPFRGKKIPVELSGEAYTIKGDFRVDNTSVTNKMCGPVLLEIAAEDQQEMKVLQPGESYSLGAFLDCPESNNVCDLFTPEYSSYTETVYLVYDYDIVELATYSLSSDEIQKICLGRIPTPTVEGNSIVLAVGDKISPENWPTDTDLVVYTPAELNNWENECNAHDYPHVLVVAGEGLCVVWYDGRSGKWDRECYAVEDLISGATYQIISALEEGECDPNNPPIKVFPAEVQTDGTQKFACQVSEPTGEKGFALGVGAVDCAQELKEKRLVWSYVGSPAVSEGYWGKQNGVFWYIDKSDAEALGFDISDVAVSDVSAEYNGLELVDTDPVDIYVPTAECKGGSADLNYAYFKCDHACSKLEKDAFVQDFANTVDAQTSTASYYVVATCVPHEHDANYFNNYIVFHAKVQEGNYSWYEYDTETGEETEHRGGSGGRVNAQPTINITSPSDGETFTATSFPYSITIEWNASDPDGDPLVYSIDCENNGIPDANTNTTSHSCSYPSEGNYTVKVTAFDGRGGEASDTVSFYIKWAEAVEDNTLPTVTITSPEDGETFPAPADVTVEFNASDDTALSSITIDCGNGQTHTINNPSNPYPGSHTCTYDSEGNYTITVKAEDGAGNTGTASVSITVVDNTPPTITSLTHSLDNTKITFECSAEDDRALSSITITVSGVGSETCNVSDKSASCSYTITVSHGGDYNVVCEAKDAAGNTSSEQKEFVVYKYVNYASDCRDLGGDYSCQFVAEQTTYGTTAGCKLYDVSGNLYYVFKDTEIRVRDLERYVCKSNEADYYWEKIPS